MQGRSSKPAGRRATSSRARRPSERPEHALLLPRLGWLVAAGCWLFVAAALLSFDPADPPGHAAAPLNSPVANWGGVVGAWIADRMLLLLGWGAWALLVAFAIELVLLAAGKRRGQLPVRALGVLMIALAASGFHALLFPAFSSAPEGAGGLLAIAGVAELSSRFGGLGAALWIALIGVVGLVVAFDHLVLVGPAAAARWISRSLARAFAALHYRLTEYLNHRRDLADERRAARLARAQRENDLDDDESLPLRESEEALRAKRSKQRRAEQLAEVKPAKSKPVAEIEEEDEEELDEAPVAAQVDVDLDDEDEEAPGAPQVFDPEQLREKMSKLPVRFAGAARRAATEDDLAGLQSEGEEIEGYQFPPLDLLEDPDEDYSAQMDSILREQAKALEHALRLYKIDGEVVGIDSGPVITMYEVRLAPGTKVSAIETVSKDIARALKVVNVRIVPNLEGRDTIGIEAPNLKKERVRLKELMTGSDKAAKMRLPLFLGKDASGEPLIVDLADLPHMLIAGATGAGKSVCMNAIIMGFLYTKKPNELKLVLVDPKMVEMSQFRDIPHLMCPVVTEMGKAAAILEWAVTKMDERYELLAESGVRDIDGYNALEREDLFERLGAVTEEEQIRIPKRLPRMVFIIDELADLMMTNKEVETSIVRLAQKARAVGIHLILATQRPQANVVTGLIKSNMPGRLAFKVASAMDSRIVLDQKGAELLLGQGDMLFLSPRSHKLLRSQGTLVDDSEARKVVKFMKTVAAPSFERQLVQLRSPNDPEAGDEDWRDTAEKDPLFEKAVEIILETQRGSVSLLQRRLAIGYTRASRLIDLMGMAGILGEHKGSVAREVMISGEEWAAMKAQAEADAENTLWKGNASPAPVDVARSNGVAPSRTVVEPAPFDADDEDEELEDAIDEDAEDEEAEEDAELVDEEEDEDEEVADDELEDEAEDSEEEEDEEASDDDEEYEYEYEYVDEDEEESDEESEDDDELVDEEEDEESDDEDDAPEIDTSAASRPKSKR
jgi:S-DNA-T family DNA segregation ATPase FtsK/SpoIIIE